MCEGLENCDFQGKHAFHAEDFKTRMRSVMELTATN
jgi:hypothetical protein